MMHMFIGPPVIHLFNSHFSRQKPTHGIFRFLSTYRMMSIYIDQKSLDWLAETNTQVIIFLTA